MKRVLTAFVLLFAGMSSFAEVDYRVIPLPQKIEISPKGGSYVWNRSDVREILDLKTDNPEAYVITVNKKGVTVRAATKSGLFYARQTLFKSVANEPEGDVLLPYATITDEPRFPYRGAHLDVARHFMPIEFIYKYIDILALHGVNQFHWHLTDDQGWRFEVRKHPALTEKGSVRQRTVIGKNLGIYDDTPETGYYTQEEMRSVVAYAAERNINVIPEIDLPGHMLAALCAYPELGCTGGPYTIWSDWGVSPDVLCAGNDKVIPFLKDVLAEVCEVFPSEIIHIGGDESPRDRWKACPKCQAKKAELGLSRESELQTYINKELDKFLSERGRVLMGWDETLEGGLSENAMVMSWRGVDGGIAAARQRHRAVMTPGGWCYFDHYQLKNTNPQDHNLQPLAIGGYTPLSKVYSYEPVPEQLSEEERKYIVGAQCNLWSEYILSPEHVMFMLLPRLAALCEVQWTQPEQKDFEDFKKRLPAMQNIYKQRGYTYCRRYE